ncbi:MAG: efflux RND transporter periplasmic adaptor subunit [Planctomycetes bacterium]|nr:efflux RND transporter periplasmic adaptor subunit [Planctomycetota bacterium]
MSRARQRILALVIGAFLVWAFWASQRPHPTPPAGEGAGVASGVRAHAPPVRVRLGRARALELPIVVEAMGTVRSRRQTQIAARVVAEVKEILRHPGDEVRHDDVLVRLDSRDLAARKEQAEATLRARAEALAEADTDFRRAEELLPKGALPQQQYDAARFRLARAAAEREAAEKDLEVARIQLGYATITAPFDGYLFEKLADPGDLTQPGKPLLGLYDPRELRMEAMVEENHLWAVKVGESLEVQIDALGRTLTGRVSEAVPAIDPATRTGIVKVDLPADPALRPGMFGRARIRLGERRAVVVPRAAAVVRGQIELVFGRDAGRGSARMLLVRFGPEVPATAAGGAEAGAGAAANEPEIEVLSGLAGGEEVVVTAAATLLDGAPIQVGE